MYIPIKINCKQLLKEELSDKDNGLEHFCFEFFFSFILY